MNWEYSCGAVVFTRENGHILFAVVQELSGAYSFPKGHMESNETEMETARREILEETGLSPIFLPDFNTEDQVPHQRRAVHADRGIMAGKHELPRGDEPRGSHFQDCQK